MATPITIVMIQNHYWNHYNGIGKFHSILNGMEWMEWLVVRITSLGKYVRITNSSYYNFFLNLKHFWVMVVNIIMFIETRWKIYVWKIHSDAIQLLKYPKSNLFLRVKQRFMFNFEWMVLFLFFLNFTKKLDIVAKICLHYLNIIL